MKHSIIVISIQKYIKHEAYGILNCTNFNIQNFMVFSNYSPCNLFLKILYQKIIIAKTIERNTCELKSV